MEGKDLDPDAATAGINRRDGGSRDGQWWATESVWRLTAVVAACPISCQEFMGFYRQNCAAATLRRI